MEESRWLSDSLNIIFDRTIDKLILYEMVREGNSTSDFSKWSCVIEKTLKDAMSEATRNIKLSFSSYTAEMDVRKEIEICEKQKQEHVRSQIEYEKKLLDNHKRNLLKTGNVLNRKICELKDELDRQAESASKCFAHCENHEENRANIFNEKFRLEQEEWGKKIATLEREIRMENSRNAEEKMTLCAEIDNLTLAVSTVRTNWEEHCKSLTQESNEMLQTREAIRPQISIIADELIKRQLVVSQDRQEKQLAEEAHIAFVKLSMVVIQIQSWWRGILARRDYARYKIACKKKPKLKSSQHKQVVQFPNYSKHT